MPSAVRGPHRLASEPRTIVVQPTTLCNLDCAYCYLPARKHKRDMTPEVATAIVSSIPGTWPSSGQLEIVWHGGEPLAIGPSGLLNLLAAFDPLRREKRILHLVQTNATLITDEWCDLFVEHEISVGVSIDGPPTLNRNRVDWRGLPVFDRIVAGIDTLKRHDIPFTVITVVDHDNTGSAHDILDFLADLGCSFVGFNMEEKEGVNVHGRTPSIDQARHFWRDAFTWSRNNPAMKVREVEDLLEYLAMDATSRGMDAKHDPIPTVAWNGDVVLLSPELLGAHSARYADFLAGNVLVDPLPAIMDRRSGLAYVREFQIGIQRCKETCEFFAYCQGSHAGNRFFEHGDFTATETEHCRTSTQALVLALHDLSEGAPVS